MEATVASPCRQKCTEKQKVVLIEYVKKHPNLISGKQKQNFTNRDAQAGWQNISDILNAMPGAKKSWNKWKKAWQDLKCKTKNKIAGNRSSANRTGGGPLEMTPLTCVEDEIQDLIKEVSVKGHSVQESETTFNFNTLEDTTLFQNSDISDYEHDYDTQFHNSSINGKSRLNYYIHDEENPNKTIAEVIIPADSFQEESQVAQEKNKSEILNIVTNKNIKNIPKKINKFIDAATAASAYKENLERKVSLKEEYYKRKILHFDRIEEKYERICHTCETLVDYLNK